MAFTTSIMLLVLSHANHQSTSVTGTVRWVWINVWDTCKYITVQPFAEVLWLYQDVKNWSEVISSFLVQQLLDVFCQVGLKSVYSMMQFKLHSLIIITLYTIFKLRYRIIKLIFYIILLQIFGQIEQLFPELLKTLSDPSDEVRMH